MKLLYNVSAVVSLVFLAVGFVKAWHFGPGSDISVALFAFPAAMALSLGLYVFHLSGRIAALEKRGQEPK
jgi:hypothetical protein